MHKGNTYKNINKIDRIEDIPASVLNISCVGVETLDEIATNENGPVYGNYSIDLDQDCKLLIAETYYLEDGKTLSSRVKEITICP